MTRTEVNSAAEEEQMPELRYNNARRYNSAQGMVVGGNKNAHVVV
jgi:hypothetical protein